MPSKRPLTRLRDIVENGQAILRYTSGLNYDSFLHERLVKDGTERCLSRISEASVKLGPLAEDLFPDHSWRGIRDLGNILRHECEGVSDRVVWTIVTENLPPLLAELEVFLAQFPEDQETL